MRRWLITGGGGGIGGAVADLAGAAGDAVALVGRRDLGEAARRVEAAGAAAVAPIRIDLAAEGAPAHAVATARAELGGLDVLVNNAALHRGGRIETLDEEAVRSVLEVGLVAPLLLCREAAATMEEGGAIVNLGAVVGLRGFPGDSPYGSAKGGLAGLTQVLALELARRRITVNLVIPGFTETEMTAGIDAAARERLHRAIPLRRPAQPEEIARVVHWVSSTPYMTGAMVPVDGGLLAGFGAI